MRIEEKIKKNREVFQDSPFFSYPRESISGEIAEPFLETHKVSKVREESDEMLQEQKRVSVENAVMREAETEKQNLFLRKNRLYKRRHLFLKAFL